MRTFFSPGSGDAVAPPGGQPAQGGTGARAPLAVVIGAGFGGLAAALRLACKGWRVQILEKLDAPGGRAYVWRQDGFTFDAGPTIVTVPHLFEELWALAGRRLGDDVTLKPMDPFYRIRFDDGTWFDYSGDDTRMRAEVAKFSPEDVPGFDRLMRESDRCYRLGFEELGPIAFETLGDLAYSVPHMTRMRAWRSIYRMVCSHLRHPKLRIVMSFHPLLIGGNPLAVTCAYSLIHALERRFGVHWAMGGTGSLVRGLVKLLAERGVGLRCNAEVQRILVDGGRATGVELAGGERIAADIVISNGDTAWTYKHLVASRHRKRWSDARLDAARYSMSLFVWYFGTNRRWDDVPHHMMVLGPRYEGLLTDIFKRHHLADDFSLYLHRPSASDPSVAPPGCDTFYALSPVPHLDSGTAWREFGATYRQRVLERLERTVLPGLGAHIVTCRTMTPQDFHDRLLSHKGAAFGMEPLLLQSAWFRPHNRSEDIEGLFMVGAGTHPGAGVPGVLMSAKAMEKVVPHAHEFVRDSMGGLARAPA